MSYDENAEIRMDSQCTYEYEDQKDAQVADGEYLFKILQYTRKQREAKDGRPKHTEIRFQLLLETADGEVGKVWDSLPMYQKFLWKFASLSYSIGHTPANSNQVRIDWDRFIGAEGRLKVKNDKWTKKTGEVSEQLKLTYLKRAAEPEGMDF